MASPIHQREGLHYAFSENNLSTHAFRTLHATHHTATNSSGSIISSYSLVPESGGGVVIVIHYSTLQGSDTAQSALNISPELRANHFTPALEE